MFEIAFLIIAAIFGYIHGFTDGISGSKTTLWGFILNIIAYFKSHPPMGIEYVFQMIN